MLSRLFVESNAERPVAEKVKRKLTEHEMNASAFFSLLPSQLRCATSLVRWRLYAKHESAAKWGVWRTLAGAEFERTPKRDEAKRMLAEYEANASICRLFY